MIRWLLLLPVTAWAFGAIYFDGPFSDHRTNLWLAIPWAAVASWIVLFVRPARNRNLLWLVAFLTVLLPWLTIAPSNDRQWRADWAETGWVSIEGDVVTFHNFRDFDYARDGKVTERWHRRVVRLSNLRGLDYFQDAFGGEFIAHPIISFDFGPDGHVALSIETRREIGESFSEFGGLYKMFELQYIFGSERDLIRLRTNQWNEPVYLYKTRFSHEETLGILHDSIRTQNELRHNPRFYNVATANCTTSYRQQTTRSKRSKFDYRMLANGKLDELVYERGGIESDGLPFAELRKRALINDAALKAHDDPSFSKRIRVDRPGFGT